MTQMEQIGAFLEDHRPAMLELWKELVNMESYVGEPENVEKVLRRLKEEFEKEGFSCRIEDVGGGWAGTLVGIWGEENGGGNPFCSPAIWTPCSPKEAGEKIPSASKETRPSGQVLWT